MIRHLVFYTAKPGQEAALTAALAEMGPKLTGAIPGFLEFTSGENFLEDKPGGFTHAICARFQDRESLYNRRSYPAHRELLERTTDLQCGRAVVDFEY